MRGYAELSKCKGQFYRNKAQYMGWTACRQLDNQNATTTDAVPSKQPGFCNLDDATKSILQYQVNLRTVGLTNHVWLNGMACYHGVSYMSSPANVMGNRMQI